MKTKFFHFVAAVKGDDELVRKVTVVGKFDQKYIQKEMKEEVPIEVKPNSIVQGKLTYPKRTLKRTLTIGYSICNPEDEFDMETGINIAKRRIREKDDLGTLETSNPTMLTKDMIESIILCKWAYIAENLEKFINR